MKQILYFFLPLLLVVSAKGQHLTEDIRLNQVGFYPDASKIAAVVDAEGGPFYIIGGEGRDTLFAGTLSAARQDPLSSESVRIADFSDFGLPGTYIAAVPGKGHSHAFEIRPHVHAAVARAALKGFYYQRASTTLPVEYAGKWQRIAGHPDTAVRVHASAATDRRPAGTLIASPGGWYDAGDYNKYIVNSGITTATLLSLYEDFPAATDTLAVQIPEQGDRIPDLLNEALWNVRWMLTMQDPHDGGVYHKLTAADFEGVAMPSEARAVRYVVQKSTAAALDFAAVMAQAARILRQHEQQLPGLADSCLTAALQAWQWARSHPDVIYDQPALNKRYDPDVNTGAYGDKALLDEFAWASAELYVTTRADSFYHAVPILDRRPLSVPNWRQVHALAYYTLSRHSDKLTPAARPDLREIEQRITDLADVLIEDVTDRPYRTVMGRSEDDFAWGSNAVAANQGIALIQAYRLTRSVHYLQGALSNLDYLLGRNATGYSFVTGYGDKRAMHPHHRISEADAVIDPVPGLLIGGPNPGRQDECAYPSMQVSQSYVDDWCSYASNEIAINWNAPLAYLTTALEILQEDLSREAH